MKTNQYLIVVDVQKDFVDGVLGTKEAVAIMPAVVDKIKKFPILLVGKDYWQPLFEQLHLMASEQTIDINDLELLKISDNVQEGMEHINQIIKEHFVQSQEYKPKWWFFESRK
jgi:predicted Rossmann-fold nucleotide-binding protein